MAQSFSVSEDPEGTGKIFNGMLTFEDLNNESSFKWLKDGAATYKPDMAEVGKLQRLGDYKMVIFLGTWCDDSHELIPKLEKVLEAIHYPMNKLTMYGVDRSKETTGGQQKKYDITLVPTVILFDGSGKEAGRITESVTKSIEGDLAAILQKQQ